MSACSEPKQLEYKEFNNVRTEQLGFSTSVLKVDILYFNPNNFGLQLKSTDLDIFIDSTFLGHTAQDFQIHIPRKGEFTLPLRIEVEMKNLMKNALPALLGKEVLIKIVGKVKLGKANVYKSFEVNYQGRQKLSF
jgi:LEA14-like dessication related protein